MTDKQQPEALRQAAWLKKEGASCQRHYDLGVLIERQHAELETLTLYKSLADEYGLSIFKDLKDLTTEIETLRAKLKTHEDLGDAGSDVQLLRMGYAAARLEIESLRKEHADELAGASREKELAAQQPGAAGLIGALEDAQRAINSMKVEAETAAQGDEQMMLEACETISNEGLQADMAIRAALASHGQAPAAVAGPSKAITASIMRDDGGDHPAFCLMVAYRSQADAEAALELLAAAPTTQPAPPLPERDASVPAERQGLFRKFDVRRVDGTDKPGGKHYGCTYFVLDVDHDPCARPALAAYAAACEATHPALADDLRTKWGAAPTTQPATWDEGVQAVAAMLAKKADDFALEHGHDDMGGLSFGSGAHAEAKMDWHSGLLELEEEARAMLGRVFPMTGDEEESDLGDWQDGTAKPTQDGTYLREFDEGPGTSEFHQGKWLRDGFFPSDIQDARWRGRAAPTTQPSPAAQGDALDAARWRALLACGRIRIIGTAGVTGTGAHDPKALDPNKQPYGNYVHFGAEFWSTFPDQDYYNTKENPAYARATLTEFADAARAAQEGK